MGKRGPKPKAAVKARAISGDVSVAPGPGILTIGSQKEITPGHFMDLCRQVKRKIEEGLAD